jgi:rhamnogalacturonyl hydrolase YesR
LVALPSASSADSLQSAAERVAAQVVAANKSYKNVNPYLSRTYTLDLTLEALLELSEVSENPAWRKHALAVIKRRGLTPATPLPYQAQPFTAINYALYRATGDHAWLPVFVRESEFWRREAARSPEGAVLTYSRSRTHVRALLIDSVQEYGARMARCGQITGDVTFHQECVTQFRLFRQLLRNPQSGLWSQGRGWIEGKPADLSPGAWSRGHGWLLRGLTAALAATPRKSDEFRELQSLLAEFADALLPLQQPSGMWHTLLHRPPAESPAETSGTAMIATAFSRAWREKLLDDIRLRESAGKAFAALPARVDERGVVLGTSPGPGPLETEAPYLNAEFRPDDPHGAFAVLFAAAEALRLERARQ